MSTTMRGKGMRCFLLSGLGTALLLVSCSAGSIRSSHTSTETTAAKGCAAQATPGVAIADAYTPVVASGLAAPTFPVRGTSMKYHVVYDLEFLNASSVRATLQRVEVVDADNPSKVIMSYADAALVDRLRTLMGARGAVQDARIEASGGRIFYIELAFDALAQAPAALQHHVYVLGAANPAAREPTPMDYTITPYLISAGTPIVIGPPVAGKGWVALNGCCKPGVPHRQSDAPNNGRIVNGQRFAIDWKRMNDQGAFYVGDKTRNESYVDYGADVLAVADGTIVETLDILESNKPGILPSKDPVLAARLNVQNVEGNHIVLDLRNGIFAFYAHLEKGTLKVKKGDAVKKGDKIAQLGNSGNSSTSHLHFHLVDGPSPLGSNGVPYVISNFDYVSQVSPRQFQDADDYLTGTFGQLLPSPQPRTNQLPLAWAIADFPN